MRPQYTGQSSRVQHTAVTRTDKGLHPHAAHSLTRWHMRKLTHTYERVYLSLQLISKEFSLDRRVPLIFICFFAHSFNKTYQIAFKIQALCQDFQASLVAQLIKTHLQCRRLQFDSWVRKICWRRNRLPTLGFQGFPGGSDGKESSCNAGDLGSVPGLGGSPREGKDYPLQYSGLENSMDHSPRGCKELDMTEPLLLSPNPQVSFHFVYGFLRKSF